MSAIIPISVMTLTGLFLGFIVSLIVKFFSDPVDPKLEEITNLLSGANCGGCGFAGCADFGRALVEGRATPDQCPSTPKDNVAKISELLGVTTQDRKPQVAFIRCNGDHSKTTQRQYNGVADCRAANAVAGGFKSCQYGCLGLGTCVHVCPFNAISLQENGIPVVDRNQCVGCKKCVDVCPRHLITLVPKKAIVHVACNNPTRGPAKIKACKSACIGCHKCDKAVPGLMKFNGFMAEVDYTQPLPDDATLDALVAACPVHCIIKEENHG